MPSPYNDPVTIDSERLRQSATQIETGLSPICRQPQPCTHAPTSYAPSRSHYSEQDRYVLGLPLVRALSPLSARPEHGVPEGCRQGAGFGLKPSLDVKSLPPQACLVGLNEVPALLLTILHHASGQYQETETFVAQCKEGLDGAVCTEASGMRCAVERGNLLVALGLGVPTRAANLFSREPVGFETQRGALRRQGAASLARSREEGLRNRRRNRACPRKALSTTRLHTRCAVSHVKSNGPAKLMQLDDLRKCLEIALVMNVWAAPEESHLLPTSNIGSRIVLSETFLPQDRACHAEIAYHTHCGASSPCCARFSSSFLVFRRFHPRQQKSHLSKKTLPGK